MTQEKKIDKRKRSPKVHKSLRLSQENLDYLEKINQIKIKAGKKSSVANALDDLISSARKHKRLPTYEVKKIDMDTAEMLAIATILSRLSDEIVGIKDIEKRNSNNINQIAKYLNMHKNDADASVFYQKLREINDNYDAIYDQLTEISEEVSEACQRLSI